MFGCARTNACWTGTTCVAPGAQNNGNCRSCQPSLGDSLNGYAGVSPDATSCGNGNADPYGSPCSICLAGVCGTSPWASDEPGSLCRIN